MDQLQRQSPTAVYRTLSSFPFRLKAPECGNLHLSRVKISGLIAALLCTAMLGCGLALFGPGFINVVSLTEHPFELWFFFLAPILGLMLALCFLFLPSIIGINVVVFCALWAAAEIIYGAVSHPLMVEGDPQPLRAETYMKLDPRVGYVLVPNNEAHHRELINGAIAYDVRYIIDGLGRRKVETPHLPGADRFMLFFGDSNTFGEGLAQGDTLPDEMQRRWPQWVAYNYGVHGYGIAQMLDVIATRNLPRELGEKDGIAFYYFIPAHMDRLVGSSLVAPSWGRHFSYYRLAPNGAPLRLADFAYGRPLLTLAYGLLSRSNVIRHYGVTLPLRYSDADYALAAAIVAQSRDFLEKMLALDGFYFVMSPTIGAEQAERSAKISTALRSRGIAVIDLTTALDLKERRYRVAGDDYHQSSEANRIIADRISAAIESKLSN